MSVTTTANPQTYNLRAVLADYDLHHTPESTPRLDTSLNPHPSSSQTSNPTNWPTAARRIPDYRPVNRNLVQSERRVYQNGVEQAFVGVMFTGVVMEATIAKVWRATFGRVWDVAYGVGGEW
ncbi:hypothetical protein DM02DRAFT_669140 [Periconia macrospinosa]|uniref:Uncharacterized protein n=1 Tax=Periconia macrospinosa TaxID=97972 RepID=A0A2V1E1X3_9PLEO|nr:hypothetical protein DM02DRAFT_669140 [Periconia macrospinosa]